MYFPVLSLQEEFGGVNVVCPIKQDTAYPFLQQRTEKQATVLAVSSKPGVSWLS